MPANFPRETWRLEIFRGCLPPLFWISIFCVLEGTNSIRIVKIEIEFNLI